MDLTIKRIQPKGLLLAGQDRREVTSEKTASTQPQEVEMCVTGEQTAETPRRVRGQPLTKKAEGQFLP